MPETGREKQSLANTAQVSSRLPPLHSHALVVLGIASSTLVILQTWLTFKTFDEREPVSKSTAAIIA